jgi:outer membrane protein TolC
MRRNHNAAPSVPVDVAAALRPRPEEIAARAYELYESRGLVDGADLDDWLEAERQLVRERTNELAGV